MWYWVNEFQDKNVLLISCLCSLPICFGKWSSTSSMMLPILAYQQLQNNLVLAGKYGAKIIFMHVI